MNMDHQPNNLIETTKEFWTPRLGRTVSAEEAREMIENVAGFFSLLAGWDAVEQEPKDAGDHSQSIYSDAGLVHGPAIVSVQNKSDHSKGRNQHGKIGD